MDKILYLLRKEILNNDCFLEEYSGEIYSDAITGYQRLKSEKPKVIVVDLGLDKINGLEIITMIRSNPDYHHLKVVAVSKDFNLRLANLAYNAGSDYYLTYPINQNFIKKILELSRFEEDMFKLL